MSALRPLVALAAAIATSALVARVDACSCFSITPAEALDRATVVFSGRVTGYDETRPRHVWLAVERVWKGNVEARMIFPNSRDEAACDFVFEVNERYLVYVRNGDVSTCSRTGRLADAREDLAVLGAGQPPK